ncbi:hypothetical protein GY45DRAFT_1328644 [Cubamyces sp. BRFM 1775]|nr:hypothetical protein GY45DRAFT_1328644 [Cubamyces sp. BRFM 1775]
MDNVDVSELHLPMQERVQLAISRLPHLSKGEIPLQESCPICLTPFDTILENEAAGDASEGVPLEQGEKAGVTKLVACGHIFCRACLVEWIQGRHGSCPSCRNVFSSIRPVSESDNESSDGDYVPGDDEDEEDDGFFDSDGSAFDDMDVEFADEERFVDLDYGHDIPIGEEWPSRRTRREEHMENWGLSDGEGGSESMSEVEMLAFSAELEPADDDANVYNDDSDSDPVQAPVEDPTAARK